MAKIACKCFASQRWRLVLDAQRRRRHGSALALLSISETFCAYAWRVAVSHKWLGVAHSFTVSYVGRVDSESRGGSSKVLRLEQFKMRNMMLFMST